VLPFLLCSAKNVKEVADKSGQVDFAETMEMENRNGNTESGNTESTEHACSQVPSCADLTCDAAIGRVFFEVYLSCFCLVRGYLSSESPIKVAHLVDCAVAHSLCLYPVTSSQEVGCFH